MKSAGYQHVTKIEIRKLLAMIQNMLQLRHIRKTSATQWRRYEWINEWMNGWVGGWKIESAY